jgi:hypothetical protein
MLCEFFLGIEPHWALWRRIFVVRPHLNYQTGGFSCTVRPKVEYFKFRRLRTIPAGEQGGFTPRSSLPPVRSSDLKNYAPLMPFGPGRLGRTSWPKKKWQLRSP